MRHFFEKVEDYEFRIEIFSRLTGIWIFINFITQLPVYRSLWGGVEHLIVSREAYGRKLPIALDLLTHFPSLAPFVYAITIISSCFLIWGKHHILLRILLWYTVWLLDAQAWTVQDGGNNLMHLTLFYSILFNIRSSDKQNFIPKLGVRAIQTQVLIIYFCAFLSKVSGSLWQNGTALHYIIQIDKFHSSFLTNLFLVSPIFVPILSYFTILSQLILLTLLPVQRWRMLAVVLGIAIHLGIALHIGLIMFSLVMIFHYSIFITKEDLRYLISLKSNISLHWKYAFSFLFIIILIAAGILISKTNGSRYFSNNTLGTITNTLKEESKILVYKSDIAAEMITKSGIQIISNDTFSQMQLEYGSITKLVTALEFISLEQKQLISRNDKIKLKDGTSVSLNDLLFHQSGIADIELNKTTSSIAAEQLYTISDNKSFKYSNTNYALVGRYIESIMHSQLKYDVDKSQDYSMIKINERPDVAPFYRPAFGIVGTGNELILLLQKIKKQNLPCIDNMCWGGFMNSRRFITVGKIASGTSLAAIDPDGTITILSSNDYTIDLTKILEVMK